MYLVILGTVQVSNTVDMGLARTADNMVKCLVCTKTFKHNSTARRHYKEIHYSNPGETHPCPYCGREYTLARYLKEHLANVHQITQKMLNQSYI